MFCAFVNAPPPTCLIQYVLDHRQTHISNQSIWKCYHLKPTESWSHGQTLAGNVQHFWEVWALRLSALRVGTHAFSPPTRLAEPTVLAVTQVDNCLFCQQTYSKGTIFQLFQVQVSLGKALAFHAGPCTVTSVEPR